MTKTNDILKIKKKKSKLKIVEVGSASIVTNKKKLKIVPSSNNSVCPSTVKTNKKPKIKIVEEPSKNNNQTFTIKPKKKGKKKKLNITDNTNSKVEKKPEMNDFQTFVRDCKKADYEYIKFHGKTKWVGPAIMLDNDSNITEIDIRKSTTVKLDKETFDMCIVLYPSNYCDPLSVGYPQQDDVDDTIINQTTISNSSSNKVNPIQEMLDGDEDEFEVVPWFHDGKQYNVNPVDNYLYDIDSDECIGKRVIDNDSRKYNIDFTDLDG